MASSDDDFVQARPSARGGAAVCSDPQDDRLAASDATFHVGDRFGSFAELEKAIAAYSSTNFVQLWKRDARTINAAKKRVGNIASKMGEHLKYQSVKYCCIHGGKKFTSTATERTSS